MDRRPGTDRRRARAASGPSSEPLTVVIGDHRPIDRLGARAALEADGGFAVIAEVADAATAVQVVRATRPDLCLLEARMPGNGIRAAYEISKGAPETAVVMLTASELDSDLFGALRAGAAGYLLKDTDPGRLPHALRGVLAGEAAVPRALVARVIEEFRGRGRRRTRLAARTRVELTSREWEVLELMRGGLGSNEMAERMFVSPVTVRRHVSAVLRKLGVGSRDEAVELLEGHER